jgi:hypothetical protein
LSFGVVGEKGDAPNAGSSEELEGEGEGDATGRTAVSLVFLEKMLWPLTAAKGEVCDA